MRPTLTRPARLFAVVAATAAAARGAEPSTRPAAGPTVVRLTLHPVAVADPPLRYELLPPLADQHPGDAAYEYAMAAISLPSYENYDPSNPKATDFWSRFDRQYDATVGTFSPTEAAELVTRLPTTRIDSAARCERAHWDVGYREHGVDTLLPHLNHIRMLAEVADVQTRVALAHNDYPAAARTLQTNFAMVRQLRAEPFLVQALVAAGIARLTLDKAVQEWVSRPNAPNLYWPLSGMPQSFTDPYAVAETERALLRFTDPPWLALAMDDRLPPDQWPRVLDVLTRLRLLDVITTRDGPAPPAFDTVRRREVAELDRPARDRLRADGRPAAAVAAMSADEVVGRYLLWQYGSVYDQMWKAWPLPFPQAADPLRQADDGFHRFIPTDDAVMGRLHPLRSRYTLARADEQLAALRVVEALRDHAARHGGRPPATLDEVVDLPIPPDPVTGRPFEYHADGVTATLTLPVPAGVGGKSGTRYELTFVAP